HPRIHHQFDPEEPQARDLRQRRAVPRHHCTGGIEDRGGAACHAGDARRSAAMAGDPVPARLRADRGPQFPQRGRWHVGRDSLRDAYRAAAGARQVGIVDLPPSLAPTFLQLDFSRVAETTFLIVIFSFLFVDLFDNAGTLIGVAHRAGLLDKDGNLPRMKQALLADSFAAMFRALIGTSTTTSYIESAAGPSARRR